MANIEIPSFDWSAFYYPQILEQLIQFKRINVAELTDESVHEPLIQLLRAFALVGHLNNTNADMLANENTLPTARLAENIRNMLRLIDYELSSASPAQVDIVFKLTQPLAIATQIIAQYSQVATRSQATGTVITFEILEALTAEASSEGDITKVFAYDNSTTTYTDYTSEANSVPGDDFTPWASPAARDILYVGHDSVMWDKLNVALDTAGSGLTGIWEFYDGNFLDGHPNSVAIVGSTLRFEVNNLLGTSDRSGTLMRVQLDQTGSFEENIVSEWADYGSGDKNYITTSTLLGQQVGDWDNDSDHYTAGRPWKELSVSGDAINLSLAGDVDYVLPETLTLEWAQGEVNSETNYWLRYRIISVSTPTAPVIDQLKIDTGNQYVKAVAVQGKLQQESSLGISDGSADQEFQTAREGVIDDSQTVTVDGVEWQAVENFLQSTATSMHYTFQLGENDRGFIKFGDGIRGLIPGNGQTIAASYRYGVDTNGIVGENSITVDKSGLVNVSTLWNPRPSAGWQESQSASEESLELAKILGPASLRVSSVALGPGDIETLTEAYTDPATGSRIFSRSYANEGAFGSKTTEIIVVATGGGPASSEQLEALELYFNGDKYAYPPVEKLLVANQEVVATNYEPITVNISATVYNATSIDAVEDSLTALLNPEAKEEDGITFEWEFGGTIYLSDMIKKIHLTDSSIIKVDNLLINGSAADLALELRQLPIAGAITITAG